MSFINTEETGVRPVPAPPSIDYGAGVPFKKRRFPFIRPPSPPLLQDEGTELKQVEFFSPADGSVVLKSSVAVEYPPSSVEEPSFRLESSENINLNEVDGVHSDDLDKHFSLIQKRPDFSKGLELSPSSDAPNVDQKDKPEEKENLVLSDRTWGSTELMSVPSGSRESEVIQGSGGHQNVVGYGRSSDLTLTFGQNIEPVCWHQVNSSLSDRENEHCLVGVDRSNWDLNATMDDSGGSALVFSYGTAPCGNSISARKNDKKDAGQNLLMLEHRSVVDRTTSSYDYKDHHPGRCLDRTTSSYDSRSMKVETDCTNQQMNMMDENSSSQQEVSYFYALLPKESEAKHINGPPGVESFQSVLASSAGCKDEHLIENDDNPMGRSSHRPEGDAGNASGDCTVTNVATNGSVVQTSRLMIMARDENTKKRDDVVAKLMTKDDLFSAAKEIVKDDGENSACNEEKIEIAGCEDSDSCNSNNELDRVPSVLPDHAEISDEENDDYEDGEVRGQFVFGECRAGRGAEQVETFRAVEYYCTGVASTDLSLACEEANVELQLTATAACTLNVDKDQSQSLELSLKERVSSNPDCSFDLGELLDGDLTKRLKKEMVSSAVNAPSVTQLGINARVKTDRAISIEGKEDGNSLPETEVLVNSEVTSEDANVEGSKRKIITLSSLSTVPSPDKAKFVTNRPLQMRSVRKRLPGTALEVDKPHLRGRNRACADEFDELSKRRNQYSFYRNPRSKFGWDRGIASNSIIHNRDVNREFSPDSYNYPEECKTTRCRSRYASGYQNSNLASEGRIRGDGCWNGYGPCFHRQSSTRHSPGRRDGAPACAKPRDTSPVGCNGMDGFGMVSLRSNSKFRRDPRDDNLDSMFACSQMSCDYDAGGIADGDRKLPSFKSCRVHVRSRSNSPVIRSRSPIQGSNWRRSPEGFRGHLELSHRRSAAVYRGNRMRSRSPGRGCFHGKMTRGQTPPYLPQNLEESRQIHSERDYLFPRSRLTSRSSPGRGTFRIRRYNVNTRDWPCSDYSKGNMRALWSKDINRQGESDERSLNEEGGHRRFPSPHDGSDVSDMYSTDEAAAPYHFCPENRPMYHERGKSRVKPIDRTRNRSGYVRKSLKLEDQEGSYRRRRLCEEFDHDQCMRKRFRDHGQQD